MDLSSGTGDDVRANTREQAESFVPEGRLIVAGVLTPGMQGRPNRVPLGTPEMLPIVSAVPPARDPYASLPAAEAAGYFQRSLLDLLKGKID